LEVADRLDGFLESLVVHFGFYTWFLYRDSKLVNAGVRKQAH
jgi:hypothetical protein